MRLRGGGIVGLGGFSSTLLMQGVVTGEIGVGLRKKGKKKGGGGGLVIYLIIDI